MSEQVRTKDYRDLLVWQKGVQLAMKIHELTSTFPPEEKFGLVSQMRRSAVSVPSNIAEGQARRTTGEFLQFLSHAQGSLAELDTQLELSVKFGYCLPATAKPIFADILELRKMLNALRLKLLARH
jgi:four helix bundle protein